jgi:hypothetical protein
VARLTKRQVEQLISTYDTDPSAALLAALRIVLNNNTIEWVEATLKMPAHISVDALQHKDITVLDQLLTHLVECRDLQQP